MNGGNFFFSLNWILYILQWFLSLPRNQMKVFWNWSGKHVLDIQCQKLIHGLINNNKRMLGFLKYQVLIFITFITLLWRVNVFITFITFITSYHTKHIFYLRRNPYKHLKMLLNKCFLSGEFVMRNFIRLMEKDNF